MVRLLLYFTIVSNLLLSVFGAPHGAPIIDSKSTDEGFIASESSSHQSGGENYLVIFNSSHAQLPHVADVLSRVQLSSDHSDVHQIYNGTVLRGFCASMKSHCIDALNAMEDVAHVEKVVTVSTTNVRQQATWGLNRLSSVDPVLGKGSPKRLEFNYNYPDGDSLGGGVDVYVVDTGVNTEHVAFGGRANLHSYLSSQEDDNGHGTHVGGTATGAVFGVASGANLWGLKVLDSSGSGPSSTTMQAIVDIIEIHNRKKSMPGFKGSVINMSFNLQRSAALNAAVEAAMENGIHAIIAAGNEATDACSFSPASLGGSRGNAITVGSVGITESISRFSNTGSCVDLYAPGENVVSAWMGGPNVVNAIDGTSMATPHVTGLVAYHIARKPELAQDPVAMKAFIMSTTISGQLSGNPNPGDSMLLANNGFRG